MSDELLDYSKLSAVAEAVDEFLSEAAMKTTYEEWFQSRNIEWDGWERWRYEKSVSVMAELLDELKAEIALKGSVDSGPMGALMGTIGAAIELAFAFGLEAARADDDQFEQS